MANLLRSGHTNIMLQRLTPRRPREELGAVALLLRTSVSRW